ncbi:hypothetical protein BK140_01145 [Paenibacillus macerans]|nr:hypothetical protein BK140_01145 [Paenibacillus macerans]
MIPFDQVAERKTSSGEIIFVEKQIGSRYFKPTPIKLIRIKLTPAVQTPRFPHLFCFFFPLLEPLF